jgi:NADPH:quinone reductase-like Zn-dependent oxidoreductase
MKLRYKITSGFLIFLVITMTSLGLALSYNSACEPAPALSGDVELMKAIVYRCYGSPDILSFEDVEKPVPAADEVLVKVHAAGVNPLDWHYMRGSPYFMRLGTGIGSPADPRMGVDFAGTVEAVGSDVKDFKPGDEVFGGSNGAFAEYVTVKEGRALALKPGNVTFEQAASVPIAAITALQALRDKGALQKGQRVLINGASGGVGTFAVQIAKSLGAEVTGVCSTRNVEMVRSIGADNVFDYTQEDYTQSGERYDLIVDMVGNHSLLANRQVMTPEGRLVLVGGPKGNWFAPIMGPLKAMMLSPFVGQEFGMILARLDGDDLALLGAMMETGKLVSEIDRTYRLSEVPDALRYSESGRARGKIIVKLD